MKALAVIFCGLLVAGSVSAQGVYNMAKQQAKNASAKEAQNQRAIDTGTPPAAPSRPPPPANPPPNPALEATLQNISNLRADFENPTNKLPLLNDLSAAAQGAKASSASISKLAGDLTTVVAGNAKLRTQHQKLAQNIHAMFNSSHLSPAQQQQILDGVQKILLDGGTSPEDTAKVIGDLKTIANETK